MEKLEDLFDKFANDNFNTFLITINNNVPQKFVHAFDNGRLFTIYLKYNKTQDNWIMDIYETTQKIEAVALGITLTAGLDLLSQYKYKNLGEFYVLPKDYRNLDTPTYDTLNSQFYFLWRHN